MLPYYARTFKNALESGLAAVDASITVMTGPKRQRRCSDDEWLHILADAFALGASVLAWARRYDMSTARIYTWRNKLRQPPDLAEFVEALVNEVGDRDG